MCTPHSRTGPRLLPNSSQKPRWRASTSSASPTTTPRRGGIRPRTQPGSTGSASSAGWRSPVATKASASTCCPTSTTPMTRAWPRSCRRRGGRVSTGPISSSNAWPRTIRSTWMQCSRSPVRTRRSAVRTSPMPSWRPGSSRRARRPSHRSCPVAESTMWRCRRSTRSPRSVSSAKPGVCRSSPTRVRPCADVSCPIPR